MTLEAGGSTELVFYVNVARNADIKTHSVPVVLINKSDGSILRSGNLELQVIKKSLPPGLRGDDGSPVTGVIYTPAFDLVHKLSPTDSIVSGSVTNLTLSFVNSGNTTMKNTIVTWVCPKELP